MFFNSGDTDICYHCYLVKVMTMAVIHIKDRGGQIFSDKKLLAKYFP